MCRVCFWAEAGPVPRRASTAPATNKLVILPSIASSLVCRPALVFDTISDAQKRALPNRTLGHAARTDQGAPLPGLLRLQFEAESIVAYGCICSESAANHP